MFEGKERMEIFQDVICRMDKVLDVLWYIKGCEVLGICNDDFENDSEIWSCEIMVLLDEKVYGE